MGFFSSRKSESGQVLSRHEREKSREGHGASGSSSAVAVIRSKWYNKSRSKTAPDTTRVDEPMDTELTLRVDAYRRNTTAEPESNRTTVADPITKTIAERLNELTKSHAEGMIDDETYRDLRASLFERFGAASHPPAESNHVRISADPSSSSATASKRHSIGRPDSNFHLAPRPPSMSMSLSSRPHTPAGPAHSIRSTTSRASTVATAVTGLLRRGTRQKHSGSRRGDSRPGSPDSASMFSVTSSAAAYPNPHAHLRGLQGSTPSLGSTGGGARAPSLSSRRTGRSGLTSRTYATPPSSYHRHAHGQAYSSTAGTDTDVRSKTESELSVSADLSEYDDKSPAELREAMIRTEREGRKLLDAFNGLELTVLTKYRGAGGAMGVGMGIGMAGVGGSGWTHVRHPSEMGVMGGGSTRRAVAGKGSSSSLYTAPPPPTTSSQLRPHPHPNKARSLSISGNHSPGGNGSVRSRSPQPPTVHEEDGAVADGDPDVARLHREMEDIRRRRADVASRYETRLEMLRVKLKSAELRDKVSR
ncbi:hypothetical protein BDV93DRAFT_553358 [Ceratobasidium sp. AG-I]|nr:hypothetical protein BDV93DRAFT_553358 [Ceratobasidium sp. AG-I]